MPFGMIFNDIEKDYVTVLEKEVPYWSTINVDVQKIPGKRGGFSSKKEVDVKRIPVTLLISTGSEEDFNAKKREIADWLVQDEPKKLIFTEDPDHFMYAEVDGDVTPEKDNNIITISFEFLCTDPDVYGLEQEVEFDDGDIVIQNEGSLDTKPIIEATVKEDISFMQVAKHSGEYMQIGDPTNVEEVIVDPLPLVFETMGDFEGWTDEGLKSPENGIIAGAWATEETVWFPSFYGDGGLWHGPGRRYDLPRLIQDFWVEMVVTFRVWRNQDVNNLELYLIDSDNEYMAKIKLKNESSNHKNVLVDIAVGGQDNRHYITQNFQGFRRGSYTEFFGRVFIRRSGNEWWGQAGLRDEDGKYHNRSSDDRFNDINGDHEKQLAAIQVHAGAYKDLSDQTVVYIHSVTVREGNNPQMSEVPLIAREGDKITFDHATGEILLAGDEVSDLKDFGSNFFSLDRGRNELFLFPASSFDAKVKYRDKFL